MLQQKTKKSHAVTFKHFSHQNYAVFQSLKREIRIGCLSACVLTFAHIETFASRADSTQMLHQQMPDVLLDNAEVTGSRVPLTFAETANKVSVITRQDIERAKAQSVNDLLKLCVGIDVRQRGADGVQTDISIGGGTFDQIAILLNGVSINDPQTGHHSADFPVAIADIERIEIYDGASARTFGSQALNGAINIITKTENRNITGFHTDGGSFGTFGDGAFLNLASQHFLNRISGDYLRSDGGTQNSAFHKSRAFYHGDYVTPDLKFSWQYGFTSQCYGANTFYSEKFPNQWESGSRHMAAIKAVTNGQIHFVPSLSWLRSFDHFQLIHNTSTGENFHRNDVFTSGLTTYTNWALGRTAVGGEIRYEGILSTNLGHPLATDQQVKVENQDSIFYNHRDSRTNVSFFAEHDILLKQFTFSAGVMANRNSAINERFTFYPGLDLSYRPFDGLKLFASWNKSLRLPTFTDLYYKSPTQEGNVGLHPEKTSTFKIGADYQRTAFSASVNGIYRHGTDMIDWVMFSATDVYHSINFKVDNYEFQAQCSIDFNRLFGAQFPLQSISMGYFYNYQQRHDNQYIYQSNYALDYLRHKIIFNLNQRIWHDLSASWYLRWQERCGNWLSFHDGITERIAYHPYALLSCKLQWNRPRYNLYASFDNITNHRYYDLGSVPQPGFWLMLGGNIQFNL